MPPGCSFAPRCTAALARCHVQEPPEFQVAEKRIARCWLVEPGAKTRPELVGSNAA
jgi:ABC-type dipeptide/oligopeptide/nickel transport system ATPase component